MIHTRVIHIFGLFFLPKNFVFDKNKENMSYEENESAGELSFKIDDEEEEPMELPEDGSDFKFDEEEEDDPEDRFH
jgi:hypothetical protein